MSAWVVDASVALKWFVPETDSDAARRYLDPRDSLLAPELMLVEFANVSLKKARRREISEGEAVAMLQRLTRMQIVLWSHTPIIQQAARWAIAYQQSAYDCLYLSLAAAQQCRMVTADKRFYNSIMRTPLARHIAWVAAEA